MSSSVELVQRVQTARTKVQSQIDARIRSEAGLDAVKTEARELRDLMVAEGIEPNDLDRLIAEASEELESKLSTLEAALND